MTATINGVVVVMEPPEDYVVDFDNPQRNYVLANYLVAGFGMVFAFLFLAQRLYVKAFITRSFALEDYCCVIAWAFTVAMQGLMINGFAARMYGVHAWEMSIEKFARYNLMANYIQAIIYVPPTLLSKLCLLIFYINLQNRRLWYQCAVWGTIFVTVGSNFGILFSIAFACKPIKMAYDITVTVGTCIDRPAVFKATAAFGIITDVLIFLIPIPMVVTLRLSRRKKICLLVMFAIGSATVVTSVVRLILLMDNLSKPDLPWIGALIFLWVLTSTPACYCHSLTHAQLGRVQSTYYVFMPTDAQILLPKRGPRVVGYSTRDGGKAGSNTPGNGSSYARGGVSTISSGRPKPHREHYQGFSDSEEEIRGYRMQTLGEDGTHQAPKMTPSPGGVEVMITADHGESSSRDSGDKDRDDDSAKAIIHTRTVQVSYEDRHPV
uniref:Rhodopsin domain-containing protein n=1 Tax=Bionectria ochroleuca TaxID=29856 RepID=A0A8H7K6U7_BIOOC